MSWSNDTKPSSATYTGDSEVGWRIKWSQAHRTWANSHYTWASSNLNATYDTKPTTSINETWSYDTKPA